ncbi:MAG: DnaJ domain-containing protein [Pseudomonadales bacterium]
MLIVLGALAALLAALWLISRSIRAWRSGDRGTLFALIAALGAVALAALIATGRMHWLGALAAAALPFLRRLGGLFRLLPLIGSVLRSTRGARSGARTPGAARTAMSRREALHVLGLEEDATDAAIIEAHRRLMQRVHPDRGGSAFLAQQLNEARRVLLDDRKT